MMRHTLEPDMKKSTNTAVRKSGMSPPGERHDRPSVYQNHWTIPLVQNACPHPFRVGETIV
ncbi:MAG: hypothetical protein QCI38_03085 [Candidatus Thermoplasmatota archaeon]|nr:hypothetical protein [Candidatus Thermoplasmatota archaeon]